MGHRSAASAPGTPVARTAQHRFAKTIGLRRVDKHVAWLERGTSRPCRWSGCGFQRRMLTSRRRDAARLRLDKDRIASPQAPHPPRCRTFKNLDPRWAASGWAASRWLDGLRPMRFRADVGGAGGKRRLTSSRIAGQDRMVPPYAGSCTVHANRCGDHGNALEATTARPGRRCKSAGRRGWEWKEPSILRTW